jgi:hypothetical protein
MEDALKQLTRKLLYAFFIAALITISSLCFAEEKGDGYGWEGHSKDLKSIYLSAYLSGVKNGILRGMLKNGDLTSSLITAMIDHCSKDAKPTKAMLEMCNDYKTSQKIVKAAAITNAQIAVQIFIKELKETDYYVNEIDSFLKTYPLCRRKHISIILLELNGVWFGEYETNQPTYKSIGESCANSK